MTKVAIVGANGYSGEELCAILARHPRVKIASVTSRQHAGKRVTDVLVRLTGLSGISSLLFSEPSIEELLGSGADFVFLALPHGLASEFAAPLIEAGKKVVDLSADFRLRDAAVFREFYGDEHTAPELLRKRSSAFRRSTARKSPERAWWRPRDAIQPAYSFPSFRC